MRAELPPWMFVRGEVSLKRSFRKTLTENRTVNAESKTMSRENRMCINGERNSVQVKRRGRSRGKEKEKKRGMDDGEDTACKSERK